MEKSWKVSCVGLVALAIIIAITMLFSSPVSAEEMVNSFTSEELERLEYLDRELRYTAGYLMANGIETAVRYYMPDETIEVSDLHVDVFNPKEYPADEFAIYLPRTLFLNESDIIKELDNSIEVIFSGKEISLLKGDKYYVLIPNTELAEAVFKLHETESVESDRQFGSVYAGVFWLYAIGWIGTFDEDVWNGEALIRQENFKVKEAKINGIDEELLQKELNEIGEYLNKKRINKVIKYWLDEGYWCDYCEILYTSELEDNILHANQYVSYIERPMRLDEIWKLRVGRDKKIINALYKLFDIKKNAWDSRHIDVVYQGKHVSLIRMDGEYMITINTDLARETFKRYETKANLTEEDIFANQFLVYRESE